jgi:hypothetical protein
MSILKFSKSIYKSLYYFKTMVITFFTFFLKVQMLMNKFKFWKFIKLKFRFDNVQKFEFIFKLRFS